MFALQSVQAHVPDPGKYLGCLRWPIYWLRCVFSENADETLTRIALQCWAEFSSGSVKQTYKSAWSAASLSSSHCVNPTENQPFQIFADYCKRLLPSKGSYTNWFKVWITFGRHIFFYRPVLFPVRSNAWMALHSPAQLFATILNTIIKSTTAVFEQLATESECFRPLKLVKISISLMRGTV